MHAGPNRVLFLQHAHAAGDACGVAVSVADGGAGFEPGFPDRPAVLVSGGLRLRFEGGADEAMAGAARQRVGVDSAANAPRVVRAGVDDLRAGDRWDGLALDTAEVFAGPAAAFGGGAPGGLAQRSMAFSVANCSELDVRLLYLLSYLCRYCLPSGDRCPRDRWACRWES